MTCIDCGGPITHSATGGPPKPSQRRCPKCVDKILFGPRIMELASGHKGGDGQ